MKRRAQTRTSLCLPLIFCNVLSIKRFCINSGLADFCKSKCSRFHFLPWFFAESETYYLPSRFKMFFGIGFGLVGAYKKSNAEEISEL